MNRDRFTWSNVLTLFLRQFIIRSLLFHLAKSSSTQLYCRKHHIMKLDRFDAICMIKNKSPNDFYTKPTADSVLSSSEDFVIYFDVSQCTLIYLAIFVEKRIDLFFIVS